MKKAWLLSLVLLVVCLCGCTGKKPEEIGQTTLYVRNDGSVEATFVEDFSQPHYDMAELQAMAEDEITAYNTATGEQRVEMTFYEVEGNVAKMQIIYASFEDYVSMNNENIFVGTVADALEVGWDLNISLVNPQDAEDVIGEHELLTMQESNIVIVENALRVRTESPFLYISSEAVYIDECEVDGYDNPDATVIIY